MTDYPSRGLADGTTALASSAVSWSAVLGGAVVSASISLMLLSAGAGLGFTSVSPWSNAGVAATTFGIAALIWLALVHLIAAGAGGYLAGRLRTKRVGLHTDEVAFRDTAHGFMTWAVSAIVTAVLLACTAFMIIGGTARLGATAASGVASSVSGIVSQAAGSVDLSNLDPSAYLTDSLFRTDRPASASTDTGPARAEVGRIVAMSIRNGEMAPADKAYVASVISIQTGISPPDAEKRINDAIAKTKEAAAKAEQTARETADVARKGAASFALATFIAMLIGALASSYGATVGGRARDKVED
ncbi:hypothetical protein DK26_15160 [Bosea sp. WAO]|uniref:hypothetical protein n=1 Tax=Bosea sp. WAO TaxID=406341 RepID=UPI000748013B|nr:hypothetical protein [Bosea sp. WAO]KUL94345.1 hypothetical protein DK26_15160 [Bosea sp. WAO]